MNKIVLNPIKIDLHIHSKKSSFKDKDIVKNSDINNISILTNALISNGVNLCSITDHDSFDYQLYSKLKEQETIDNCIKKVLPGVEFTVTFSRNGNSKQLHVIAIFDDENDEKVKNIGEILKFNSSNRPNYNCNESYNEEMFLSILSKIDLDTLLIVHQKQTLSSSSKPKQNDANSLGSEALNEFILTEYFEAFEFKNKKNEVFNNLEKQNYENDSLRFITGSDCHDWNVYPQHDSNCKDVEFAHTYIKSLPTFRGLSFALTDDSRISLVDNFFTTDSDNFIEKISLSINENKIDIPLSRGINVIIGDNSIGKSLLLHKLTDYYRLTIEPSLSPINKNIVKGYNEYLEENKICINTTLNQNMIFGFDTQGEIRKKFNQGALKSKSFFETKYPLDVDTKEIQDKILAIVDELIQSITNKFEYDSSYKCIGNMDLLKDEINPTSLSIINCDEKIHKDMLEKISKIVFARNEAISKLKNLANLDISDVEKEKVNELIKLLDNENKKTIRQKDELINQNKIINSINTTFKAVRDEKSNVNTGDNNIFSKYVNYVQTLTNQISSAIKNKNKVKDFNYNIDEYYIKPNEQPYLNYIFIKKTRIEKVNKQYVDSLLSLPFKKNQKFVKITELDRSTFINMLSKYDESENSNPIDFYRDKILKEIEKDFKNIPSIVQFKDNSRKDYSDGVNAHVYFDIISSNIYQKGIYLIDQPEDDVSPAAIKKYLLKDFKCMGKDRQILLITHNPQFVVNLDVDNIICITKNDEKEIKIISGALEYKDQEVDIIKTVAETLEGGIESIKKRWKRYEKNSDN
ncbi:MAG: hypothetical protein ACLSUV_07430 [Bacilli bacterium]|jgi:PHP N-terminal domain protein